MPELTWSNETRRLGDLKPQEDKAQVKQLVVIVDRRTSLMLKWQQALYCGDAAPFICDGNG